MSTNTIEAIKALKELLDMGAITQEEFDAKKAELLSVPVSGATGATSAQSQVATQGAPVQPPVQQPQHEQVATSNPAATPSKSKTTAGLLALLLGGAGVHKFYLGYTAEGAIMLCANLFCIVLSIFLALFSLGSLAICIIALIEAIIYFTKDEAAFYATYVQGHKGWF